jgi:hypothetical protein
MTVLAVFRRSVEAVRDGVLIVR